MTFKTLILQSTWPRVEPVLRRLGAEAADLEAYRSIFQYLQAADSEPNDMRLVIEQQNLGDDAMTPVVFGRNGTLKPDENEEEGYDLAFVRREKWLSVTIDKRTAASYSESEIVAYCLEEMTSVSFSPFEIEQKLDEVRGLVDEIRQEGASQVRPEHGPEHAPSDG